MALFFLCFLNSAGILAQMPVNEVFGKLRALELKQLSVLIHDAIQRKTDFPWTRECLRVFYGCFIANQIMAGHGESLYDMEGVAVKVADTVEPRLIVQAGDIDDEGV